MQRIKIIRFELEPEQTIKVKTGDIILRFGQDKEKVYFSVLTSDEKPDIYKKFVILDAKQPKPENSIGLQMIHDKDFPAYKYIIYDCGEIPDPLGTRHSALQAPSSKLQAPSPSKTRLTMQLKS